MKPPESLEVRANLNAFWGRVALRHREDPNPATGRVRIGAGLITAEYDNPIVFVQVPEVEDFEVEFERSGHVFLAEGEPSYIEIFTLTELNSIHPMTEAEVRDWVKSWIAPSSTHPGARLLRKIKSGPPLEPGSIKAQILERWDAQAGC